MSKLTVKEMAAALGLERNASDGWEDDTGVVAESLVYRDGWVSWPIGKSYDGREEHPTEHAAMLRLYRLHFPEVAPEPAAVPVKRSNVEIVLAAYKAWQKLPKVTDDQNTNVRIDNATEAAFASMLAEAFVADQVEVDRG